MTDINPKIADAAVNALKVAGLAFDDRDVVKLVDTSMIYLASPERAVVPPAFVAKAKAEHPDWFFDAMSATAAEINQRVSSMAREHAKADIAAQNAAFLDSLRRKYA